MIIVFAGAQAAAADGSEAKDHRRLSSTQVEDVRARVRRFLARVKPTSVIGAAASGADLVVLEAASAEGIPARVVLPFERTTFRQTSVESKGSMWSDAYDRVLRQLGDIDPMLVEEGSGDPAEGDVYKEHNATLLDRAHAIAIAGERVWVLVVRPRDSTGTVTDDLVARAEGQGLVVIDLDPQRGPDIRTSAFVAMPYGTKFDPVSRRNIDCDEIFDRVYVPVLEDLDVEWLRADLDTDSGIVHVGMIEALANSDLVVGDLSTLNPNVAYEIGLRHALSERATVLVAPQLVDGNRAFPVPFDVSPIRVARLARSLSLTDEQAEAAVKALKPVVAEAIATVRADSPVTTWFEHHPPKPLLRRAEQSAAIERETKLRSLVAQATRSSVPVALTDAGHAVADADVAEQVRLSLRLQLAKAMYEEGLYVDSRNLLILAEPANGDPRRLLWLQQHAMALRRIAEVERANGADGAVEWDEAEGLLNEAMSYGDSEETLGIAGGLVKRRLLVALADDNRILAAGLLGRMEELYMRGFMAEPSYYAGINLLAALRLRGQRYDHDDKALARARQLLPVVKFFAERAHELEPDDLWPVASLGELALHEALLADPVTPDASPSARWYAQLVTRPRSADVRRSASDQLRFFIASGDPREPLEELMQLVSEPDA